MNLNKRQYYHLTKMIHAGMFWYVLKNVTFSTSSWCWYILQFMEIQRIYLFLSVYWLVYSTMGKGNDPKEANVYYTPRKRSLVGYIGFILSVWLYVRPSVRPSVCLSVCLSTVCVHDFVGACSEKWVYGFFWKCTLNTHRLKMCT